MFSDSRHLKKVTCINSGDVEFFFHHDQLLFDTGTGYKVAYTQYSRIRIFRFFQILKKRDFLRFFEMTPKKRKKSVAKILSSIMLTLLQKNLKFVECL